MLLELSHDELAAHMAGNPHNLPRVAGFPPLDNWNYHRGKYQAEGRKAGPNAPNPYAAYNAGSLAATNFATGQAMAGAAQ